MVLPSVSSVIRSPLNQLSSSFQHALLLSQLLEDILIQLYLLLCSLPYYPTLSWFPLIFFLSLKLIFFSLWFTYPLGGFTLVSLWILFSHGAPFSLTTDYILYWYVLGYLLLQQLIWSFTHNFSCIFPTSRSSLFSALSFLSHYPLFHSRQSFLFSEIYFSQVNSLYVSNQDLLLQKDHCHEFLKHIINNFKTSANCQVDQSQANFNNNNNDKEQGRLVTWSK